MSFRKRTFGERFWEIIPGAMFWATAFFAIFFSANHPVGVAVFIIIFDLYWLFKAVNGAAHLISAYRKLKLFETINWQEYARKLSDFLSYSVFLDEQSNQAKTAFSRKYHESEKERIEKLIGKGRRGGEFMDYYHLVVLPFVNESFEVLSTTFEALKKINYPRERLMVILASEERAGAAAAQAAAEIKAKFAEDFYRLFVTVHPDGLAGEIRGKSANASYAVGSVLPELENMGIAVEQVLVSNFDSDTIVHPEYFGRVIYEFLTAEKPYRRSYQPIALYNNNIWDSPSFIRVVSVSNSFWQFIESSRPNRLRTFSSHTMTLRALIDAGFWRKDLVNEDGYIFWQCFFHYKGDYEVTPLFISVSLDTCLADTYTQTLVNQYKQKRRWAYNVEYYPTLMPALLKMKISLWEKIYKVFQFVEGNYTWATASIVIAALGWLPLVLGGQVFRQSVVALNLPQVTSFLMTIATIFLIFSVLINIVLLPPRPAKYSIWRTINMYLQWFLVPIVSVVFGSLPAVEAQTRLMLGRYMEFWVTPKTRKGDIQAQLGAEAKT